MSCLVLCKSSSEGEGQGNSLVLMLRSVVANDVKRILKRLKRQYKAWQCLPKNTRIFPREDQWVLLNGVCPAKDSRLPISEHLLLPFCSWQKSQGLGNRHTTLLGRIPKRSCSVGLHLVTSHFPLQEKRLKCESTLATGIRRSNRLL